MVEVVFVATGTSRQGAKALVDSSTTNLVFPAFQGVLSVMLIFSVLEFCLAVLMAMIWWKEFHSEFPGVSVMPRLPESCLAYLRFWVVLSSCQQKWQKGPLVAGREIQIGGGLLVMDDR